MPGTKVWSRISNGRRLHCTPDDWRSCGWEDRVSELLAKVQHNTCFDCSLRKHESKMPDSKECKLQPGHEGVDCRTARNRWLLGGRYSKVHRERDRRLVRGGSVQRKSIHDCRILEIPQHWLSHRRVQSSLRTRRRLERSKLKS